MWKAARAAERAGVDRVIDTCFTFVALAGHTRAKERGKNKKGRLGKEEKESSIWHCVRSSARQQLQIVLQNQFCHIVGIFFSCFKTQICVRSLKSF